MGQRAIAAGGSEGDGHQGLGIFGVKVEGVREGDEGTPIQVSKADTCLPRYDAANATGGLDPRTESELAVTNSMHGDSWDQHCCLPSHTLLARG